MNLLLISYTFIAILFIDLLMENLTDKILYSSSENEPLQEYIGIGSTDCDPQDPESYLLPDDRSFDGWKHFLSNNNNLAPILAINYVLISGIPEAYFPEHILENFNRNRLEMRKIVPYLSIWIFHLLVWMKKQLK